MKPKVKYILFPLILLILVVFLSFFNIHGSSIGEYHKVFFTEESDPYLLFGRSRGIRSDEWMAGTPQLISQILNDFPIVNEDIANGMNLAYGYGSPTKSFLTIFKPQLWIFFLVYNIDFAFSFYWWIRIVLLSISFYLLLLEITKKNIFLSILGASLLVFTPFIQWWTSPETITMISFAIYFFIKIIKEELSKNHILYGIGFAFSLTSFALILYPPFQLSLAWMTLFLGIGVILNSKKTILSNKAETLKKILLLILASSIVIMVMYFYFKTFADVVSLITNTSYPGARFISPGLGDIRYLLSGFFDILLQKDSNGVPFGNQSEMSNFFMLYFTLIPWVLYTNIKNIIKKIPLDWIGLTLALGLTFLTSWYALPLPDIFSKITGLYMVLPGRLVIGLGFANYMLIIHLLSTNYYIPNLRNRLDIIFLTIVVVVTGVLFYKTGEFLYNLNPNFFSWPEILSPLLKIIGVTVLTSLLVLLTILRKKISIIILLLFGIISTIFVNPLYKSLDIITQTDLAKYIQDISTKDDSVWIVYGDYVYTHYVYANGGHVLNGMHNYPQFGIWKKLDPEEQYYGTYNRFAHVFMSEYTEGETMINLAQNDAIEINISPCDTKLDKLDVKYILSTVELQNTSCLSELKTFENAVIYTRQEN